MPDDSPPKLSPLSLWQRLLLRRAEPQELHAAMTELMETAPADSPASPEQAMLSNMLRFRDVRVHDCMTPRARIVAVPLATPLAELVRLMAREQHSRLPVFRASLDDVVGMVHLKDVFACIAERRDCLLADLVREVPFVPPSMPAQKLLLQMRQSRQHLALVVDEFGGIDGLVTIEDLLEQIIGAIDDEHDEALGPAVTRRADGSLLVAADLELEAFTHEAGFALPRPAAGEMTTVGGLVAALAGRLPAVGDVIEDPGHHLSYEIVEADAQRLQRIRIRRPVSGQPAPPSLRVVG